jgi:hypothetical protein
LKRWFVIAAALCSLLLAGSLHAERGERGDGDRGKLTIAVFGDWPYSQALLDHAYLLVNSINADPEVRLVLHVGDIHSGSMPCTGVGLVPAPPASKPLWNLGVFDVFQQFKDPVVYTPGDNEWTDCHKTKQGSSGDPLKELASVRSLFFSKPGQTLGGRRKQVFSQAQEWDPFHPTDLKFVENVLWIES